MRKLTIYGLALLMISIIPIFVSNYLSGMAMSQIENATLELSSDEEMQSNLSQIWDAFNIVGWASLLVSIILIISPYIK